MVVGYEAQQRPKEMTEIKRSGCENVHCYATVFDGGDRARA
jgi:hypothetical protein